MTSSEHSSLPDLQAAWGGLLQAVGADWFVTLTYRGSIGPWAAGQRFGEFTREVRYRTGHRPEFVRVTESHRDRLTPHHHALFYNVRTRAGDTLDRADLQDWAYERFGKTSILPYDARLGAGLYLAKYVAKGADRLTIDFSRNYGRGRG